MSLVQSIGCIQCQAVEGQYVHVASRLDYSHGVTILQSETLNVFTNLRERALKIIVAHSSREEASTIQP